MTCRLIAAIIFYKRTVHVDHEGDATTDLTITLSSMLPSTADKLTEYSAWQSILHKSCCCPRLPSHMATAQGFAAVEPIDERRRHHPPEHTAQDHGHPEHAGKARGDGVQPVEGHDRNHRRKSRGAHRYAGQSELC